MVNIKEHEMIELTFDPLFKSLFGKEKNKDLLVFLINTLLKLNITEDDIIINNTELYKENINATGKTVDLIVTIKNSIILNIELNGNTNYPGLINRNVAYISKIYSEQFEIKQDYYKTSKKCIQINLNNFGITKEKDMLIYNLNDNGIKLTSNIEIYYIDIEKVSKECYDKDIKRFMKVMMSKNYKEIEENTKYMGKLGEKLVREVKELSNEKFIYGLYDKKKDEEMIRNSIRYGAYDEGFGKGVQTGFNNGFTNGVKTTIKNMLKKEIPINVVSEITGLTTKEIEEIK